MNIKTHAGKSGLNESPDNLSISELKPLFEKMQQTYFEIENSKNHYRELYEFAPETYLALEDDGTIVECNNAAALLFNVSKDSLLQNQFNHFVCDTCKNLWDRQFLLAKKSRVLQSTELVLFGPNGSPVFARIKILYKPEETSNPLYLVSVTDISAYKKAHDELRIAAAAFETEDGMLVTDKRKKILRVNKAYSRITGYPTDEVPDYPPTFLQPNKQNTDCYQSIWESVDKTGYWQGEVLEKRKNGEVYPAWVTLTAVLGEGDCLTHYVCSFRDITTQKEAEKILLSTQNELENQMTNTIDELERNRHKIAEINTAFSVLLNHRETDKQQSQQVFARDMEDAVLPFLNKLKNACTGRIQSSQLVGVIENNLMDLLKSYGRLDNTSSALQQLTPIELQVATLVRQGYSTKNIAKTLHISGGTVGIHRNHIRKKLGLTHRTDNLQNFLKSLQE